MMAEGDYVMVHSRYSNPDGSAIIVVDIMRIKDDVFEEHWGVIRRSYWTRRFSWTSAAATSCPYIDRRPCPA